MRRGTNRRQQCTGIAVAGAFTVTVLAIGGIVTPLPGIEPVRASAGTDLPEKVTVSDSVEFDADTLPGDPGEIQSTIIAPNQNSSCPEGRLLISNDQNKSPGQVVSVSLDNLTEPPLHATFSTVPSSWNFHRRIRSNDHDLVTLLSGEVLLVKMGQAKYPLSPEPVWFDHAYKLSRDTNGMLTEPPWGPGARSEILVWRSADCGKTFEYVSSIDTAKVDDGYGTANDGSGGLPQNSDAVVSPGSPQPLWQMGGTDGPLVRVDPETGDVLLTMELVGDRPIPGPLFLLSDVPLNRSVVLKSSDKGSSWQQVAALPFASWRLDIVPQSGTNGLMMTIGEDGWDPATNQGYAFVAPFFAGTYWPDGVPFLSAVAPAKTGSWGGWPSKPPLTDKAMDGPMEANITGQTILTRSPSSKNLILAYRNYFPLAVFHYNMYVFKSPSSWLPLAPIVPKVPFSNNFVLHVTPVDPGRGPLLFYWYDVDSIAKKATIRGKLITRDDAETVNFAISRTGQVEYAFDVSDKRWYGDYHTAGGYAVDSYWSKDWQHGSYHYYPIWVEPNGNIRVAHITFNVPNTTTIHELVDLPDPLIYKDLTVRPETYDVTKLTFRRTEEEDDRRSRQPR
jgi:hypothetical protein